MKMKTLLLSILGIVVTSTVMVAKSETKEKLTPYQLSNLKVVAHSDGTAKTGEHLGTDTFDAEMLFTYNGKVIPIRTGFSVSYRSMKERENLLKVPPTNIVIGDISIGQNITEKENTSKVELDKLKVAGISEDVFKKELNKRYMKVFYN